ncbi:hypothetical protein F5148DRAFT_1176809 [Russula earlei]|uniref:Uncharacterized protein n=1 Tax=Russula earlei TaxID=71964 RepID=A0ACC0UGU9_9AGAM|nr:hypothetical protein F5148DRAFT_1176809 [Russula earlei]
MSCPRDLMEFFVAPLAGPACAAATDIPDLFNTLGVDGEPGNRRIAVGCTEVGTALVVLSIVRGEGDRGKDGFYVRNAVGLMSYRHVGTLTLTLAH